jgi:transcriptional regulator with XRE-family HTH domain
MTEVTDADEAQQLGRYVSQFRKLRGLSVRGLASEAGVSSSFVSQLENGRTNASVASLRKLASALGVTPAELLDGKNGHTRGILRAEDRPHLPLAGADKYVLSKPPMRNLEVYAGHFAPGGSTGEEAYVHGNAQEIIVVTAGTIVVQLAGEDYVLHRNDSIEFLTSVPHLVRNDSDKEAELLWVMSPPTPDEEVVE